MNIRIVEECWGINRIVELIKEIESRKEHPNAAATYKDVPALQEIDRINTTKVLCGAL